MQQRINYCQHDKQIHFHRLNHMTHAVVFHLWRLKTCELVNGSTSMCMSVGVQQRTCITYHFEWKSEKEQTMTEHMQQRQWQWQQNIRQWGQSRGQCGSGRTREQRLQNSFHHIVIKRFSFIVSTTSFNATVAHSVGIAREGNFVPCLNDERTYSKYLDSGSEFELSVLLGIQWLAF